MGELQIFAVLLICVVLQSYQADFCTEKIGFDGYGIMLIGVTLGIMPAVVYLFVVNAKEDFKDDHQDAPTANPRRTPWTWSTISTKSRGSPLELSRICFQRPPAPHCIWSCRGM